MKNININNKHIKASIHEWGNKNNPTIICLHGLGSTSLSFLELAENLKDIFYIVSIDLPGHGRTPAFEKEEDFEIPNLIDWLSKVINEITKDKFYLLAHSWGGDVALHYANKYQERVKKILLLDGGYYNKKDLYKVASKLYEEGKLQGKSSTSLEEEIKFYENDFDTYIFDTWEDVIKVEKNAYKKWSPLKEIASRDLMKEENGKLRFRASGDTARAAIKSMYKHPTHKVFEDTSINILLLQSTLPETWDFIRSSLLKKIDGNSNIKIKKMKETTHLLHWDKPDVITDEIINWFK